MLDSLFSPFHFKNIQLNNRIVMPGLASFLIENDGTITEKTVEHYKMRAAGGSAMVIVEACAVSPEGIVSPHQARIYDDRFIEGLYRISSTLKSEGTVAAVQIHHGGRQTSAKVIKRKPYAPSDLPCPTIRGDVEPLTLEGIQEIVRKFGDAAERAVQAGFEMIEIHGAHGYLINQFLSPFSNIRDDEYGGDVTGRTRFAKEIVQEIKRRIGLDFPLSFKISAQEFVPRGLTTDTSIKILKQLVSAGVDIVQVSAGNDATPEWICQPMFMKKGCLTGSASRFKEALDIPVMSVGRINDPVLANDIIAKNQADLVCIGRGLLADPEMPRKAAEGRLDDIRICIACNTCMESIFRRGRVECLVNPTLGREKEMALKPTETPKDIMVVGGGPGGLNVAWVAARRGHRVTLYEKQSELGGQLILGTITDYKKELQTLIDFQKRQVEKSGVRCRLGVEVSIDTVRSEKPDVVVLATGAVPVNPPLEGIDQPIVVSLSNVLNGETPDMMKTVVIGGGATGCEVALHLADNGSPVTIVEKLPKLGVQIESITRKMILKRLKARNARIMTSVHVKRIVENGVLLEDESGAEHFLEAERVVIVIGNKAYDGLSEEIASMGIPVHQVGDCIEPRSAKAAIYEAAVIGRTI